MPDMPQPGAAPAAPAPQGQSPQQPQQGGGIGEAIVQVDATLNKITQAVTQNDNVGDDVKQAFQSALEAFRGAAT